ncbi:uncharacterized protein F5891DRAFT_1018602 [Suillus fuscotomentosus]|uniref:Uncharacterized protein n=1 Tax=Suillus fuscotomentosus TaxID=1912939 RepID=A0AAD4EBM2_9AGAM|nr:uncharacterized protein F5891DRAFT_1018602 [Suillus fuscotomentosus]KAG1903295.1 hypothetical protein F5891DRAFT_1018602 [Suillus fuscotomentosus]
MAQFTTKTATYPLAKYSRSYPTSSSSTQNLVSDAEWQHFVHPVINLYLDAKTSSAGKLVSVRLRIIWNFDSSTDSTEVDQREITLEDLDLLSFSSISNSRTNSGQPDHGLPLRAAYRDTIVGIRYLHPRLADSTCQPVYRRFQITFTTATSAAQFIDAVRPVCPCRLNPQPQPLVTRVPPVATAGLIDDIPHRGTLTAVSQALPSMGGTPFRLAPTTLLSENPSSESNLSAFAPSTPVRFTPVALSSSSTKTTSVAAPSHDGTFVTPPETLPIAIPKTSQCQASSGSIHSTKGSVPDSSQPSSSTLSSSNTMPPPPLPSSVTRSLQSENRPSEFRNSTRAQLVASLHDTPALHKLSHTELESIVAQVIREEGFAQLLASLDTMWRVKSLFGQ